MATPELKRLFIGLKVSATWPNSFPEGNIVVEKNRHVTLVFLGQQEIDKIIELIPKLPDPGFAVGTVGIFDACLFLPQRNPKTVAWHINWLDNATLIESYRQKMITFFLENNIDVPNDKRPFLSHLSIARKPFDKEGWEQGFSAFSCTIQNICLYESLGNTNYKILWQLKKP